MGQSREAPHPCLIEFMVSLSPQCETATNSATVVLNAILQVIDAQLCVQGNEAVNQISEVKNNVLVTAAAPTAYPQSSHVSK